MSQLPREYLDDISTQRFQENVARQNNKLQQTVSSNQTSIADLQAQVSAGITSTSLGFSKGEFHSITISSGTSNFSVPHTLGSVPVGWFVCDFVSSTGGSPLCRRTSWTTTALNINIVPAPTATATLKFWIIA